MSGRISLASIVLALAASFLGGLRHPARGPGRAGRLPVLALTPATAQIVGRNARLDRTPTTDYIGYWTNTDTYIQWPLNLRPGTYRVQALYSLDPRSPSSTIAVSLGGQTVTTTLHSTRNWDDYRALDLGKVTVDAPIKTLSIRATDKPMTYVMNLQMVILTPAN